MAVTLGVCDYTLANWSGLGSDYNKGDGVCDCGRGLWDPDCDGFDFTSPTIAASDFGCPADGSRYLCYKEERACFTEDAGGLPLGLCFAVGKSVPACPG